MYRWLISCLFLPLAASAGDLQQLPKNKVNVPPELNYAKEFVHSLTTLGLTVKSVKPSKWNGFFTKVTRAAWIEADKGVVEIVVFPNAREAQQVQITQGDISRNMISYTIKKSQNESPKLLEAKRPLYFTIHKNIFVKTDERILDIIIKRLSCSEK